MQHGRNTTWAMAVIAVTAIIGATVAAGVAGTVPHDLIALALIAVGFLAGNKTGQLQERVYGNDRHPPFACKWTPPEEPSHGERREGG